MSEVELIELIVKAINSSCVDLMGIVSWVKADEIIVLVLDNGQKFRIKIEPMK